MEDIEKNIPVTRSTIDSSNHYYWCNGVKIPLTMNENKLFVLMETAKFESVSKIAINDGSKMESFRTMNDYAPLGIESSGENAKMQASLTSLTLDNANLRSFDTNDLIYVAPYFKTSDGSDIGITNVFSVQLKDGKDLAKLQKLAFENNFEILGKNKFDPSIYYLSCTKESKGNALEMANYMYESGAFEYATPEFLIESMPAVDPNDTYFSSQWNLYNRTYPGIDINYLNAMTVVPSQNLSNIIVAVVDNGIYNDHNDLPLHTVSYNAHTGGATSGLYGNHGTMVAGIIGASTNNNREGIVGVASGVKIMPISICYTDDAASLGISASTPAHFANAIRFAANNRARIINNSWSFGNPSPNPDVNNAIAYAHGKGCVVVFSSGNDHPSLAVKQPAAGAPAATLVVGAIDRTGVRASYSGYGLSLDVVAPGSNIWTTTWTGGYTNSYSGTSFAAPHVSGIAALVFSVNPNLTHQQVRDVIIMSADRYPGSYSGYGYGLVNAYGAVGRAYLNNVSLTGPARPYPYTSVSYSASNAPSGVTFNNWAITPSTYVAYGITGSNLNVTFNNPGTYTLKARFRTPGGAIVELPKTVTVPDVTPFITAESHGNNEGNPVRFIVYNSHPTGTYQWRVNGMRDVNTSNVFETTITFGWDDRMVVDCRVYINGIWSDWSIPYIID